MLLLDLSLHFFGQEPKDKYFGQLRSPRVEEIGKYPKTKMFSILSSTKKGGRNNEQVGEEIMNFGQNVSLRIGTRKFRPRFDVLNISPI